MACPQKAAYLYKEGVSPSGSTRALGFGDIFHRALDIIYNDAQHQGLLVDAGVVNEVLKDIKQKDAAELYSGITDPQALYNLEYNITVAGVVLGNYFEKWQKDFGNFNWVSLEETFKAYYISASNMDMPAIPIRGKYDGVFRDSDGDLYLFETKTKGRIDDLGITDKLNYDLQAMLYMWSMKQTYGVYPKGVVYNVVRVPQLKLKKGESVPDFMRRIDEDIKERPEWYFMRYNSVFTAKEIDTWYERDFKGIMEQVYRWAVGEFNYRNSGVCNMYMTNCAFMRVCAHNDRLFLKQKATVFPELTINED